MPRSLLAIALVFTCVTTAPAQGVFVAPQGVFIDHRTRSGVVELYNPGTESTEVSISTLFGYPVSDSAGRLVLHVIEQPDASQPSAAGWIQAYPRRLTLGAKERQTIRLLGRPPAGLADGEYWARLVVTARGGAVPVTGVPDTSSIQVGLSLEVRTVIAVLYRKGAVQTGLAMSGLRAETRDDSVIARARFQRQGNAAFIGTLKARLLDAAGRPVADDAMQLAVYYDVEPRIALPVSRLAPGRYTLEVAVDTQRDELPAGAVLPAAAVQQTVAVTIPARAGTH